MFNATNKLSTRQIEEDAGIDIANDKILELAANEVKLLMAAARSESVSEREGAARELSKVLRLVEAANDTELGERVMEVITLLSKDQVYSVQGSLVEQMSCLLWECKRSAFLSQYSHSIITPLVDHTTNGLEVMRKSAIGMMGMLVEQCLLPQDCLIRLILPTLFLLSVPPEGDDSCTEERRIEAVSVLCRSLSSISSKTWIAKHFIPRYAKFLVDRSFHIRKTAVGILGLISKYFGETFAEKFAVPHLVALSSDAVWGVRKAVCEVFVDVAILCSFRIRSEILAPRFVRLLRDNSRWVSFVAFQELGPFISTFGCVDREGERPAKGEFDEELAPVLEKVVPIATVEDTTEEEDDEDGSLRGMFDDIPSVSSICQSMSDLTLIKDNEDQQSYSSNVFWSSNYDVEVIAFAKKCTTYNEPKEERKKEEEQVPMTSQVTDGECDSPCDPQVVPPALVEQFKQIVLSPNETDLNRQCAHNFPAVVLTLGRKNWRQLRSTYKALVGDVQWRTRVTLAHSLHEVASIVGEQVTEEDLLPVFDTFREDTDEVRAGVLRHLAEFYKCLGQSARRTMLSRLPHFLRLDRDNEMNWRFRLELTKQCNRLVDLYHLEDVNGTIAGMALTLATDRVAAVRHEAALLLAKILAVMVNEEWSHMKQTTESSTDTTQTPITDQFVKDVIKGFARSQRWSRRQTFVQMSNWCRWELSPHAFSSLLLPELVSLSSDPVANIRIAIARCFDGLPDDSALSTLHRLQSDPDMDVARQARQSLCGRHPEEIDVVARGVRVAVKERECLALLDNYDSVDMHISPNSSFT